jgi:hypothetical protein
VFQPFELPMTAFVQDFVQLVGMVTTCPAGTTV